MEILYVATRYININDWMIIHHMSFISTIFIRDSIVMLVSVCCLPMSALFQRYRGENKLYFNEMMSSMDHVSSLRWIFKVIDLININDWMDIHHMTFINTIFRHLSQIAPF